MSSRLCTGCGRRVPDDFDACLACGSDVGNTVRVATVTAGALPPAPPAYLPLPAGARSPADAPAEWPAPVVDGRRFTGAQDAARWLAVAGQGLLAFIYALSAIEALSLLAGGASVLLSLGVRVLIASFFLRNAWRLVTHPDHKTLQSAIRLSLVLFILSVVAAVGSLGDPIRIAIAAADAAVPVIACVLAVVARRVLGDSIPEQEGGDTWWR